MAPITSGPRAGRWDLVVDPLLGIQLVSSEAAVAQAVRFRRGLQRGEWFLNLDVGIRWYEEILGDASKTPGVEARARAAVAAAILDTPAVVSITRLDVTLDAAARTLTVTFVAQCTFGTTSALTLTVGDAR